LQDGEGKRRQNRATKKPSARLAAGWGGALIGALAATETAA
jgi:hypothetical protein